ncbi:MAG: hypothetical protein R3E89_01280 [Thiolinea sp.]
MPEQPAKLILRDWQQIRHWLEPRLAAGQVQVVSLDIFDTLLARIDTPANVQRAVCRQLAEHLGKPFTPLQVLAARQAAEQALREQALAAGLDYECRYSDLILRWLERLGVAADPELCAAVSDWSCNWKQRPCM